MIYNGKQIERQDQCPAYRNSILFATSNKISLEKCGLVLNALFKMCLPTVSVVMVLQMVSDIDDIEPSEETKNFYDQIDDGQTDQSSSDEPSGSDTNDDAIRPGDIVWGLHGCIWYPARVCTLAEVPDNLKTRFENNASTKFIAWWYGNGLYNPVTKVRDLV